MRKLNETQQKELERMKDITLAILEFTIKNSSGDTNFHKQAMAITQSTYEGGNLRGIRLLLKDMKEMATGMAPVRYAALKEEILKKFGETLR